jgi:hypothetical protein
VFGENGSGPVALAMLLQHRGGFHHWACDNRTVRQRLTDGDMGGCAADPPPPQVGVSQYMNASAGLFNWALACMLDHSQGGGRLAVSEANPSKHAGLLGFA